MGFWLQITGKQCFLWCFWAGEQTQAYLVLGWTFIKSDFWNPNLGAQEGGPLYPSELEFIIGQDRTPQGLW